MISSLQPRAFSLCVPSASVSSLPVSSLLPAPSAAPWLPMSPVPAQRAGVGSCYMACPWGPAAAALAAGSLSKRRWRPSSLPEADGQGRPGRGGHGRPLAHRVLSALARVPTPTAEPMILEQCVVVSNYREQENSELSLQAGRW